MRVVLVMIAALYYPSLRGQTDPMSGVAITIIAVIYAAIYDYLSYNKKI